MKKMSPVVAALLKNNGMKPFFWQVVGKTQRYLILRNRITREERRLRYK